jgi:protein-tyrosine phosphatase
MAAVLGRTPQHFAARQVTPALVRTADLVLTMTRDQRSAIVGAVPAAVRSTFTLREFADLVGLAREHGAEVGDGTRGERLAALLALAPRFRSVREAGDHDDIEDPYGGAREDYERALAEIRAAVADLLTALEGDRVVESFADAWSA